MRGGLTNNLLNVLLIAMLWCDLNVQQVPHIAQPQPPAPCGEATGQLPPRPMAIDATGGRTTTTTNTDATDNKAGSVSRVTTTTSGGSSNNNYGISAQRPTTTTTDSGGVNSNHNKKKSGMTNKDGKQEKKKKFVIIGTAINCARWLERLRKAVVKMLKDTENLWEFERLIIYENDSTDGTPDIMRGWNCFRNCSTTNNSTDAEAMKWLGGKVEVIADTWSEPDGTNRMDPIFDALGIEDPKKLHNKGRSVKIGYARNRLLMRLRSLYYEEKTHFDYVLMLDMDEINVILNGVKYCFTDPELPAGSWGGCCANQYDIYYDLWALRTSHKYSPDIVISENYEEWLRCDLMAPGHCDKKVPHLKRMPAYRHIPATDPPIPVRSCFSGATVYDFKYLKDNTTWYGGIYPGHYPPMLRGQEVCEHIYFHDAIYDLHPDFSMYIQPKMINAGPVYDDIRFPGLFKRKRALFELAILSRDRPRRRKYYPKGFRKTNEGFFWDNERMRNGSSVGILIHD